jgi:hypothetical protein
MHGQPFGGAADIGLTPRPQAPSDTNRENNPMHSSRAIVRLVFFSPPAMPALIPIFRNSFDSSGKTVA